MIGLGLALLFTPQPAAADAAVPQITVRPLLQPPTIDGRLDEAEWAGAVRSVGLCSQYNMELGAREAIFWVGADAANLYLALRCELPPSGDLLTRGVPDGDRDVVAALQDDSVELVIHPHLGATAGDRRYFHLIVNARGAMFDRSFDEANPNNAISTTWRLKEWQFANDTADGWWNVEIAMPLAQIGATPEDLQHPWGLRVCRNWQREWDQSRWESVTAAYEDLPTMPRVAFDPQAPVVQVLGLRGEGKPRIALSIANPGDAPADAEVSISDTWSRNPPAEFTRTLTLPAGGREEVAFEPPHGGPEGAHHTIIRVTRPGVEFPLYLRDFTWRLDRPAERWTTVREDAQAVQLQYKVYPYHRKLKARVGLQSLASRDEVTGAEVTFVKTGGDEPLARAALAFTDFAAETILDTPELTEGDYEVRVTLAGEGVPTEPIVGKYERRVFPWEHNRLGLSDRVIPPFTPIEITGRRLSTVLREHDLTGAGVWGQVTSLGRPLLRGPMRWRVKAAGADAPVTEGTLAVETAQPNLAVAVGSFTAGDAAVTVRSEWDYDGMAKVRLTLDAAPGRQIEGLSLEIPLDDAQMPYLHACGDGLRFNHAGLTPAGEGPIWDSSQANRTNIVGTFYPYVWLGGGERGLAWFADSDRGWSLDDTTPTVQLERNAGVLTLRVNLVTRPTALDQPREIEFGLQATPVKPMPEEPVNWRRWTCRDDESAPVQPFQIIGSSYYYGCMSFDFYPREHDLSIYEALSRARDSGEYDEAFVQQWMEGYKPYGIQPDTEQWTFYNNHISAGMRSAAGTPRARGWLWTPYTNPRGIGYEMAEWPSFQDEWVNFPYHERAKSGGLAYDICPVRSFQDAALWSYREMMTCFDGIYWDNIYLAANFDTVAGGAWVDERGRTHPSMGLWAMRDLIRRTALLFHEEGRPVFANVAHMTNTNLVPILSFANVNLDWEWQYGKRDFQDRFTPELTVAESVGRQCGNLPLILAGGFYDAQDPAWGWCMRTRLGVCLVHELRLWDWQPDWHYALYGKLFEFGYGSPECRVYDYWDEGFPLKVSGVDARGIVLVNGRRAIVVVTDYGEGGDCALELDLKALGLPNSVTATDLETGDTVPGVGGKVVFPLRKHDFRALRFE